MKGNFLTWEKFQEQDPKQTAVLVTYTSGTHPQLKSPFTRVLLGGFQSREEAWEWCKKENIRRKTYDKDQHAIQMEVKLLRLSKLVKEYAETHPERVSAMKLAL